MWIVAVLLLAGGGVAFLPRLTGQVAQKKDRGKGTGNSADDQVQVVAVRARRGDIPEYFNGLGTVTPINTVTVKSRVDGQLMRVLYREGEERKSRRHSNRNRPTPLPGATRTSGGAAGERIRLCSITHASI